MIPEPSLCGHALSLPRQRRSVTHHLREYIPISPLAAGEGQSTKNAQASEVGVVAPRIFPANATM